MLTIVLSVLIALVTGAAVYPIFGTWYAPIPPALLAGGLAFYLITRWRSGLVQREMEPLMALLQGRDIDGAEAVIDSVAQRHGRWVILLEQQLSVQKGMLKYAQMKWDEAEPLLVKGQWNNWQAHAALGAIHFRRGGLDKAWEHFDKSAKAQSKEAMIYVMHAVLASRSGDRERALKALAKGLEANPGSKVLTELQSRIANKKKVDVKQLPQTWYHFFPEDLLKQMAVRGRKGGPAPLPEGVVPRVQQGPPQPRGVSKKMRR